MRLFGLILGSWAIATGHAAETSTFCYKQVGELKILADVYPPEGLTRPRPVVVWIHGGALMSGTRVLAADFPLKKRLLELGFVMVSIDYRLAPETKLPEIISDVEDAFRWIHRDGPRLFSADPARLVVAGSSAGGYLTLLTGYRITPRPSALVSYWGYGDLVGTWMTEPSPWPRHHTENLSRDEVYRLVSGPPVSNANDRSGKGGASFYQYCRQHAMWPQAVSGWDPVKEPGKFYPFMPLKNVTANFPPTLLVHGLKDTDVPHEQSFLMNDELAKHGIEHRLITNPDADHGSNWSPQARAEIDQAAVEFIQAHLPK